MSEDDKEEAPLDLSAWEPQSPPSDFAERVLAKVNPPKAAPKRKPWGKIAGATVGGLAVAAALALGIARAPSSGDAIAKERVELSIGSRARAVLEPGAHVTWNGDEVTQPNGDVFYRVEPGAKFRVHTPAGDVEVKGTCFTVKVVEMQKRDMKSGAIGAALSAVAFVAVYEGKVAVSHAGQRADLGAGEAAELGKGGVTKGAAGEGERAFDAKVAAAQADLDPTAAANQNLVSQVSEYKKRLESIASQKNDLEKKLATTEKQLEAAREGGAVKPAKHDFDLDADDWKELAKNGTVKARIPCFREEQWEPSPEAMNRLGLAPQDNASIKAAYKHSTDKMWSKIKPLCAQALGSAEAAEKIGPSTCQFLILDIEEGKNGDAAKDAMKMVGEVRGGVRPAPSPNDKVSPVFNMFMAVTDGIHDFEHHLAQSLGPEEAHRLAYTDKGLCMGSSQWR